MTRFSFAMVTVGAALAVVASAGEVTAQVRLQVSRVIQTNPFPNSSLRIGDGEGMTYVPANDTLWLGDDANDAIYEVDRVSGNLLSAITKAQLARAVRLGGTTLAGESRAQDIEALAYDAGNDILYVFSTDCCPAPPGAFRLRRSSPTQPFQVETFQPLPAGFSFTGAAFHPTEGLFVAGGDHIRPYNYVTNTLGPRVPIDDRQVFGNVYGLSFSPDGRDLWVVTSADRVYRVDWPSKTLMPGYSFDLLEFQITDGRAVDIIGGQVYVFDGGGEHPVTVFNVIGGAVVPEAPSGLTATGGNGQIDLGWTDNSANETGFEIQRCAGTIATTCGGATGFGFVTTTGADATTYSDGPLGVGESYTYRVRAFNGAGFSATSNVATATTLGTSDAVLEVRVAASADDAEEYATGVVSLTSGDLELVVDGSAQTVGMRFTGVTIPRGITIQRAYVQFRVDEATSVATSLTIRGEASDNAGPFSATAGNVSSRPRTATAVGWAPVAWPTVGAVGPDQRTSNLAGVIQEIIDRPGWASGNALVLVVTGTGKRTAESWDGDPARAPLLHVEWSQGTPTNQPPEVSAGPDQAITLPTDEVGLDGMVTDDGRTAGLTTRWAQVSGPGTVVFGDPAMVDTTARFPGAGTFVLRLTADDGEFSTSDTVTVVVSPGGAATIVEVRVAAGPDDVEERPGGVALSSGDLELVTDGSTVQTVGLRFTGVAIPRGATIVAAWVQFRVDETSSDATSLTVNGEANDNAGPFTATAGNVSLRPRTAAAVGWAPVAWLTLGARGPEQRTSDLSGVIQEIVNRAGWVSGNALALVITGSGRRVAESFERNTLGAPMLHVEWQ